MESDCGVTATFMENWPEGLVRMAPPHLAHSLSADDLKALISQEPILRPLVGVECRKSFSQALKAWIGNALPRFSCGAFARLGMCSFTTRKRPPRRLTAAWQAYRQLAHPGERAASMALRRTFASEPVWLFLRAWRDIPPWTELRLFFRDRQLMGATQLHTQYFYSQLAAAASDTVVVLREAEAKIAEQLHLPRVVVDIRLTLEDAHFELVELNPFFPLTGPGLFNWTDGGDFDRTFRYRRADGVTVRLPLDLVTHLS